MNNADFTPNNVDLWIFNWKRREALNQTIRSWLNSGFEFEKIKVVSNHSSITQESIGQDVSGKVEVIQNVIRHDTSLGPHCRGYNEAYVHTFLSGKKYCICAHDDMLIQPGWAKSVVESDYEFYIAPQGDQIHIMSLEGLRTFGWWDERYSSYNHHELDYISRALHKCLYQNARASLVDIHYWENNPLYTNGNQLRYNDVGLSAYWQRMSKTEVPQTCYRGAKFDEQGTRWQVEKWGTVDNKVPGYQTTIQGVKEGTLTKEVDWYCWLDLNDLSVAKSYA